MAPGWRTPEQLGRQWTVVISLAEGPSAVHTLPRVGKTTTMRVVVFLFLSHWFIGDLDDRSVQSSTRKEAAQNAWHALKLDKVLQELRVHDEGLSSEEAAQRLHRHGHNELEEAPLASGRCSGSSSTTSWLFSFASVAFASLCPAWRVDRRLRHPCDCDPEYRPRHRPGTRGGEALAALKRLAAPGAHVSRGPPRHDPRRAPGSGREWWRGPPAGHAPPARPVA